MENADLPTTREVQQMNVAASNRHLPAHAAVSWPHLLLVALFSMMSALPVLAQTAMTVVALDTRPDVKVKMLLLRPANPVAVVVLLSGGDGIIKLADDGAIARGGNFLVRSRDKFSAHDLLVAVVDAPSDRMVGDALSNGFRQSAEHVQDLGAVITYLRKEFKLPVWLVGTSRGTVSAVAATIGLKTSGPDGVVLCSSLVSGGDGQLSKLALDQVRVPTLVVHHEEDECKFCRFADVPRLMDGLKNAPTKELITFKGGMRERNGDWRPCEAFSHHGYYGIEDSVVNAVSQWVIAKSKS
jgi:hypothetical protein